jgi:hypothetical protein
MAFENNVFINCPFDAEYIPLLRSLVFTSLYLNLTPYLSQTLSSSNIRINQIKQHIRTCKYGIHDLSRSRAMIEGELPRFNMPYELGLDIGASEFGGKKLRGKKILILEKEKYHYQKVISDIAGQDISSHHDNPEILIKKVRDWMSINSPIEIIPPSSEIWNAYNQFTEDLQTTLKESYTQKEINEMPIGDFIKFVKEWILSFKIR